MAWPIIGDIIQGIGNGFKSWNDGRVRIAEAKVTAEVARYEAEAKYAQQMLAAETSWDLEALRASEHSWKDEWLLVIWTMPFIGAFIPVVQDYVLTGFTYLGKTPMWYQSALLGMVAASFGLRWWFNKKDKE